MNKGKQFRYHLDTFQRSMPHWDTIDNEPCTEEYGIELIRRATEGDQEARACVQSCFAGIMLDWIHHHPHRGEACRLKSEESYVVQAFERFWQATSSHQRVECTTLAGVLHSLLVCLQGPFWRRCARLNDPKKRRSRRKGNRENHAGKMCRPAVRYGRCSKACLRRGESIA